MRSCEKIEMLLKNAHYFTKYSEVNIEFIYIVNRLIIAKLHMSYLYVK